MNERKLRTEKLIVELNRPHPADDIIKTYADFLRIRDFIVYYEYNPNVVTSLVRLISELWNTEERINWLSLFKVLKRYSQKSVQQVVESRRRFLMKEKVDLHPIPDNVKFLLFNLFQKCFSSNCPVGGKQVESVRRLCSSLLGGTHLNPQAEQWLCEHAITSEIILNRVLRYPVTSEIISRWAEDNFGNDVCRGRRAEMISWIIDQNPEYIVERQVLIDDFNYCNRVDLELISHYKTAYDRWKLGQEDFLSKEVDELVSKPGIPDLFRRAYIIPFVYDDNYQLRTPDFSVIDEHFNIQLDDFLRTTMLWGIAYSRLEVNVKEQLMKKHYSDSVFSTFLKIGRKYRMVGLLTWLKEQV